VQSTRCDFKLLFVVFLPQIINIINNQRADSVTMIKALFIAVVALLAGQVR
jgi:uncharacterized protein with PQ loop repeat